MGCAGVRDAGWATGVVMKFAAQLCLTFPLMGCLAGGPLGLGSTASARLRRPDLFQPGCTGHVGPNVVVCGAAERVFDDDSPAELLREARADAMRTLLEAYAAEELTVAGAQVAHTWSACEGRLLLANFTVPTARVTVRSARPTRPTPLQGGDPCAVD